MKLRMSCTALAVAVALVTVAPARTRAQGAGSPEALQAAQQLVSLVSKDLVAQTAKAMTDQAWPEIERVLGRMNPDTLAELRRQFELSMTAAMSDLMLDWPSIYARHFTAQELREIRAFYDTPTGAKALQTLPQVLAEGMAAMTLRLEATQQQTLDAFLQTLRERGQLRDRSR
jgi:hypothetical protein